MNFVILTAKVYDSEQRANEHLKFMLKSCEIQHIPLQTYGFPRAQFPGYIEITTRMQLKYLEDHKNDYTHVLYTDGGDAFFTGPFEEILEKYNKLGNPQMLTATSDTFFPRGPWNGVVPKYDCDTETEQFLNEYYPAKTPFRVPQVGGYIAEIPFLIDTFRKMLTYVFKYAGDNAHIWRDGWIEGWFRPERDLNCDIFQTDPAFQGLDIKNGRLHNMITDSYPCILHCNGGYNDQQKGKSDRIMPKWKEIYPGIDV